MRPRLPTSLWHPFQRLLPQRFLVGSESEIVVPANTSAGAMSANPVKLQNSNRH